MGRGSPGVAACPSARCTQAGQLDSSRSHRRRGCRPGSSSLAWDRRRSLRDPASADAWFNRILANVCRGELRRRSRRPAITEIEPTADGTHGALADRDELTRAIRRLVPDEQLLLALRFGRDMTVPAMAAATCMPEGTVKSRLHSAMEHLRAALEAERRAERRLEESMR